MAEICEVQPLKVVKEIKARLLSHQLYDPSNIQFVDGITEPPMTFEEHISVMKHSDELKYSCVTEPIHVLSVPGFQEFLLLIGRKQLSFRKRASGLGKVVDVPMVMYEVDHSDLKYVSYKDLKGEQEDAQLV